ncbi:Cytochrome c oxidase subunit 4 isoform 1, mitochondrial [Toxocara canis]|uniref:Cytochrome c oxidase subunit 4 n=2 Tax=Toxocara canis TaxID=6265 RepID=A0A0B2VYP0_TOXCA|nr:Cytochrome c oxidase subunit 4 isoform 1, mitochondrial [Toxocara canis]VDM41492.1 unnamed protein product [Toxocara canis]
MTTISRNVVFPRLSMRLLLTRRAVQTSARSSSGHHLEHWWGPEKAAGREVVGFGSTGDEVYQDRLDYWYPSIRFRVDDDKIKPIRAKEKGDWKKLTRDEKKMLYRYSFRQTLAEFEAPSGYWKVITATVCSVIALATFYSLFLHRFVYPEIPPTFQNEYKEAQVERMLVLEKGAFLGPAKYYDYENNRWKK